MLRFDTDGSEVHRFAVTITAIVPALVCVVGLLLYVLAKDKVSTLGLWAYVCGLLVTLFAVAHHVVKL